MKKFDPISYGGKNMKNTGNENLLRIWYTRPAADWQTEALAVGNGYMGGLIFGGIKRLQFSGIKLYTGANIRTAMFQLRRIHRKMDRLQTVRPTTSSLSGSILKIPFMRQRSWV